MESGKVFTFSLLFLVCIKFFQSFPFSREFFLLQGVMLIIFSGYLGFYIYTKIISNSGFSKYEFSIIFIALFFPLYSAFCANLMFGQPPLFGILGERDWLTVLMGLVILNKFKTKKWTEKMFENSFVFLSWFSLLLFYGIYLLLDPTLLDRSFVVFSGFKGAHYKVNPYFIVFGFIYYYLLFFNKKQIKYLVISTLFIIYVVFFDKGRGLFMVMGLMIFLITVFKSRNRIKGVISLFLISLLLFVVWKVVSPEGENVLINSFKPIFGISSVNQTVKSHSINARFDEIDNILFLFRKNPGTILFGVGGLSAKWNNGFNGEFGYFHPSDVGVLGVIFIYGFLGLFVMLIHLFFMYGGKSSVKRRESVFYNSLEYFLVFLMIRSTLTGMIFFNPAVFIIPGAVYFSIKNWSYNIDDEK